MTNHERLLAQRSPMRALAAMVPRSLLPVCPACHIRAPWHDITCPNRPR